MVLNLLFFNKFWDYEHPDFESMNIQDVNFFYERSDIDKADVVVFHIPSLNIIPQELLFLKKKRGQIWVYWSFECEVHYPGFQKDNILKLFDISATYRFDSDIPMPYTMAFKNKDWKQKPEFKSEFINAFFSSSWDASGRYDLLLELMGKLNIHSYGKIFNNKFLDEDPYKTVGLANESFSFKEETIAKYKFTLAFENAVAKDYVTEKFYQPLICGSIPIYLGAPNIDEFVPGENCFINVSSFRTVQDLVDYIKKVNEDDQLYNSYFAWKQSPIIPAFEDKLNIDPDMMTKLLNVSRKKIAENINFLT